MENSPLRNSPQTISRRHSWICPSSSLSDPEAPPAQLGETTPLAHESGSKHGSSPENAPRIIQSFARSTSIPNFSRILRRHDFARFTMDSSTPVHGPANARRHRGGAPIKRWEGKTKMSTSWDYLRRVSSSSEIIRAQKRHLMSLTSFFLGQGDLGSQRRLSRPFLLPRHFASRAESTSVWISPP